MLQKLKELTKNLCKSFLTQSQAPNPYKKKVNQNRKNNFLLSVLQLCIFNEENPINGKELLVDLLSQSHFSFIRKTERVYPRNPLQRKLQLGFTMKSTAKVVKLKSHTPVKKKSRVKSSFRSKIEILTLTCMNLSPRSVMI